jgi:transcriptional regulator GlxA family with amidase domain
MNASPTKTIVFLAAPETQILDVAGPYQVFVRAAELYLKERPKLAPPYSVALVATSGSRSIRTNCGLGLVGSETYRSWKGAIDTLLVAGGTGLDRAAKDARLLAWLRHRASQARRFGSICTGAFLLASAGLLKGKKATTHWRWAAELARRCRETTVDPDPIFIRDGNLYTTAGITAGMDLALALVEEDLGSAMALGVAREMVLYLRRPGGQSQFSTTLALQATDRKPIAELQAWVVDHLDEDLAVERLAARSHMSPRNFARVFRKETGLTPARYVERIRVEAARRRLEETRANIDRVARECGFGSPESLRRSFLRVVHVGPLEYRSRFAGAARA